MPVVEVILEDFDSINHSKKIPISLLFTVLNNSTAEKWLTLLKLTLSKGHSLERSKICNTSVSGRPIGIPGFERTNSELSRLINECINTVNEYEPDTIKHQSTDRLKQQDLNNLHKYFEELRGECTVPNTFFANAPSTVRKALEDFNMYIHEYETIISDRGIHRENTAEVLVTFENCYTRFPLKEADYSLFKPSRRFGTIYLHYCEVGKPILDVFYDNDLTVGIDNIRPLAHINADFDIYLGHSNEHKFGTEYKINISKFLASHGLSSDDKTLSIGYIPIATLIRSGETRHMDQHNFHRILGRRVSIQEVLVHDDDLYL